MAERLAPVDEYGMPYALVLPLEPPSINSDIISSEHHAFYQRYAPELQGPGGGALRISRVHDWPRWIHASYHNQFPDGLETFPGTVHERFSLLVLSCAGYLPKEGWVRTRNGRLGLSRMDSKQYDYARARVRMHPATTTNSRIPTGGPNTRKTQNYALKDIAEFFTDYSLEYGLESIKEADFVDKFLHTKSPHKKFKYGRIILREAARLAVEPIMPLYERALDDGLIRPSEPDPARVILKFPPVGEWNEHISVLENRLAA